MLCNIPPEARMAGSLEEKHRSLRLLLTGAIVVASFAPLMVVLWVMNMHFNASFDSLTRESLQNFADRHSVRINTFVEERLDSIRLLAATEGEALLMPQRFDAALKNLQGIYGDSIVDMGLVDSEGRQRVYAGPLGLASADYAAAHWFREMQDNPAPVYVSHVFLGLRQTPHFIVAVRCTLRGQPWILRATVDFARFAKVVEELRVGREGKVCVINRQGEYQTPPLVALTDTTPPGTRNVSGEELVRHARHIFGPAFASDPAQRTLDDGHSLYAMSLLNKRQWVLILRIDKDDAFALVAQADRTLYISLALISLAVLLGGLFLAWRLMDHLERLERQRDALNEHLIQAGKLSALGEMAAGIAHEINNPVAIMLEEAGWIEDILDDMTKDGNTDEISQSVAKIRNQGTRCRSITHKLLGFARKSDEPDQAVNIGDLLREMVALTDQKARNAAVDISLHIEPGLPAVRATPSVLQQIVLNLVNNAVDAMEGTGGQLSLRARLAADGHRVHVAVQDTGPGIPPEVKARIFDPFFTTKPAGKGTGLGLSICYGIVQGLGGSITLDSTPGEGATFHVLLPVDEEK